MCDLYGSVSKYYFGDTSINDSIVAPIGENRPGTKKATIAYITVHDTASIAASATAQSHAAYVSNGGGGTSWSYTVGSDGIFFQMPEDEVSYHAGDGTRPFALEDTGIAAMGRANITLDEHGYYAINGVSTTLRPYRLVGGVEVLDETIYHTSDFNDMGIFYTVGENGNWFLGKTYYNTTYEKISNYGGNQSSIGMETCVNKGGDLYKTWQLTSYLVAKLLIKYNLATK